MNTDPGKSSRGYKLSFIINTVLGGLMLLLSVFSFSLESLFPQLGGSISQGFLPGAVLCLFIASLHYAKYLSLQRQ
ncbi:MAG: hypothetical protein WCR20_07265 [Verrucomicrobiota bacterium]